MKIVLGILLLLTFLFTGCTQKERVALPQEQKPQEQTIEIPTDTKEREEMALRKSIVQSALKYINKSSGRDCSGFVELVNLENGEPYYKSGSLSQFYDNTNRSKAIFNIMKSNDKLLKEETPKIGDLVFFEDTIQKAKRKIGSFNITHVGIITQIDEDGTVHFIHNIQGKNRVDQLNTKFADAQILSGKNINSYLKRCDAKKPKEECLSSYFFSAFAAPTSSEPIKLSKN
jgi:hypothetical protein